MGLYSKKKSEWENLVHPGTAVPTVPAEDQTSGGVDPRLDREPLGAHHTVYGRAGPALSEVDAVQVALQRFVHGLVQRFHLKVRKIEKG